MNFGQFLSAIDSNDIKLVEQFLDNKSFNPAEQNNNAFIIACFCRHINIVKLLLNDKRINPTVQNNQAFINACYNENFDIIKLFIDYNIYTFEFDFKNNDKFYYLKTIYPHLKNDVEQFLINENEKKELMSLPDKIEDEEKLIIELQKSFISDKISTF